MLETIIIVSASSVSTNSRGIEVIEHEATLKVCSMSVLFYIPFPTVTVTFPYSTRQVL